MKKKNELFVGYPKNNDSDVEVYNGYIAPLQPSKEEELREEWVDFHNSLYLPGSAINTTTIFDWWMKRVKRKSKPSEEKIFDKDLADGISKINEIRLENIDLNTDNIKIIPSKEEPESKEDWEVRFDNIYSFPTTERPFEVIRRELIQLIRSEKKNELKLSMR